MVDKTKEKTTKNKTKISGRLTRALLRNRKSVLRDKMSREVSQSGDLWLVKVKCNLIRQRTVMMAKARLRLLCQIKVEFPKLIQKAKVKKKTGGFHAAIVLIPGMVWCHIEVESRPWLIRFSAILRYMASSGLAAGSLTRRDKAQKRNVAVLSR